MCVCVCVCMRALAQRDRLSRVLNEPAAAAAAVAAVAGAPAAPGGAPCLRRATVIVPSMATAGAPGAPPGAPYDGKVSSGVASSTAPQGIVLQQKILFHIKKAWGGAGRGGGGRAADEAGVDR